jgi:hypothetical protein
LYATTKELGRLKRLERTEVIEQDKVNPVAQKYARQGHPSIEELVAEQGTVFPEDPRELLGDFWPEEESIEDFLRAFHEWRGHNKSDRAA